jgi:hypothetical protein
MHRLLNSSSEDAMVSIKRMAVGLCRLGACAVAIGVGVAVGSGSYPVRKPLSDTPPTTHVETAGTQNESPPQAPISKSGKAPSQVAVSTEHAPPVQPSLAMPGIKVAQWHLSDQAESIPNQSPQSDFAAGRPVYLSMTLDGTQEAIDAMRANRPLNVEVRWVREAGPSPIGAPNLVTSLTIGRRDLADRFEQRVRSQGFFEWHSWARKDMLSPGDWTVSITGPDGHPVACGHEGQPCQFSIHIG